MKKIIFLEDNESIASGIDYALKKEGFEVTICKSIKEAKKCIKEKLYNLALLDIILPDGSGVDFYRYINSNQYNIPTIFITAKNEEDDIVDGLEIGADDYITKPFRLRELISRIKKVIKRYDVTENIQIGNIEFNEQNNVVLKNNVQIELTALEYRLLSILLENRGKIITREYLLSRIWDISYNFVNDNTLTVYMKRLRDKIEDDPNHPKIIKTVRGIGYKIENDKIL